MNDSAATAPARIGVTLATAITPVVWGTTYLVTTELLPAGHPLFASLMRALPAGLLALALTRRLPSGAWWWKSLVLGACNIGVFFPLLFVAAERLPGGVAATLAAAQPLLIAGLAVAVLGERPSWWRITWGLVGLVGVALVVLGPGAALDALGVVAGLASAASTGFGIVLTKKWGRPPGVGPMAFAGWQLTAGGMVLLAPALLFEGAPAASVIDTAALAGYAWIGLAGGLLAYALWFRGIGRLPVTATALLVLLSPLTAASLGAIVLGQALTLIQLAGFALALAAMCLGQLHVRPVSLVDRGFSVDGGRRRSPTNAGGTMAQKKKTSSSSRQSSDDNPSIKDPEVYEALRDDGASKEKAARIANASARDGRRAVGKRGGKAENYDDQTVDELRERAKELGVTGYSKLRKADLIDRLRNH